MMLSEAQVCIRLLTHNIRYAKEPPLFKGEAAWTTRRRRIISELLFHSLYSPETLICLQEALHQQVDDILRGLNAAGEEWAYAGVGRDDGRTGGEYSPVFYRPSVWKLEAFDTIWLSLTPEKPSRSWDAACTRILSIASMRHRSSGCEICVMNTHLDDQGSISRLESAKIIQKEIERRTASSRGREMPLLLAGDFNSETHGEAYQFLVQDAGLVDIQKETSEARRHGHHDTFSGFDTSSRSMRIDFVFMKHGLKHFGEDRWAAKSYAVAENRFDDEVYCSDHRAVIADVVLKLM